MNSSLQDGAENAMFIRIGYLLPTRERIMAEQPPAAPLLELAERAERVSVPLRCPSWRASPSARRRVAAAGSRLAGAVCKNQIPEIGKYNHGCKNRIRCRRATELATPWLCGVTDHSSTPPGMRMR